MADDLDLLLAAGIVVRSHLVRPDGHVTLQPGDQTGLLAASATQPLVRRLLEVLPDPIGGLAIGEGTSDVLLGYLVAGERSLPLGSISNVDGVVEVRGRLPESGDVWLLVTLLDESSTIAEFDAACRRSGANPAGVVALVDRLAQPEPRVRALVRWADHVSAPEACPVCQGRS